MHVRNIEGRRAIVSSHVPKLSFPSFLQTLPPLPPHLSSHAYITWLGCRDQYCLCEAFYPNGWIIWKRNESLALNEHGAANNFCALLSAFGAWIKKIINKFASMDHSAVFYEPVDRWHAGTFENISPKCRESNQTFININVFLKIENCKV